MVEIISEQELRELDPRWCMENLSYNDPKYQRAAQNMGSRTGNMMRELGIERMLN